VCPTDGPDPISWPGENPANYPADGKPRSYIMNAWNDYMRTILDDGEMSIFMSGGWPGSMNANQIRHPSDTIVIGEKITSSYHYHMDLSELEPSGAVGNDLFQLERSRHGGNGPQTGTGGSNYSFADGSVSFVPFAEVLWPQNRWAVTEAGRINYAVQQ